MSSADIVVKAQIARRQFFCCKKNPTDDRRSMWHQSRYRGRQRIYLQAMRSPTYLLESRVYSQKRILITSAKRLLQQNLPGADSCTAANSRVIRLPRRHGQAATEEL